MSTDGRRVVKLVDGMSSTGERRQRHVAENKIDPCWDLFRCMTVRNFGKMAEVAGTK
jgi:hypothetical protein